ncbi:hypothetical protein CEB3_c29300 [Peptococcaceae bacterium CEB3]|nr:hypothetical protein CEB3_c29300 [Peptococcaceae bacterium CEB3]
MSERPGFHYPRYSSSRILSSLGIRILANRSYCPSGMVASIPNLSVVEFLAEGSNRLPGRSLAIIRSRLACVLVVIAHSTPA